MTTNTTALSHPKEQLALDWLNQLCARHSQSYAHKLTGISPSTISRLLKGTYAGNTAKMITTILQARETELSRSSMAGRVTYIETSLARTIHKECDFTRTFARLNRIVGHSQIGKTTALNEYVRTHEDTYLITLHPSTSMTSLIRMLASALGCKAHIAPDLAINELAARLTPNSLLIVDEAHQVSHRPNGVMAFEFLRALYDKVHCGTLLCGTYTMDSWMSKGKAADVLKQLLYRGTTSYLKSYPERSDLEAIAEQYNLPEMNEEAVQYANDLIAREGLGPFCRELERAVYFAHHGGKMADWDLVLDIISESARLSTEAYGDKR